MFESKSFLKKIDLLHKYNLTNYLKTAIDIICIFLAYYLVSFFVNFEEKPVHNNFFECCFLFLIASYFFNIHKHIWRFLSFKNMMTICFCIFLWGISLFVYNFIKNFSLNGYNLIENSKQSFLMCIFTTIFLFSSRLFLRMLFENSVKTCPENELKAILIGAGSGADLFMREYKKRFKKNYKIEAILDDNPTLWGRQLFGIKIYGPIKDLVKFSKFNDIKTVIIAIPSLSKDKLIDLTKQILDLEMEVKILPSFDQLLKQPKISPEDVSAEHLLGRQAININEKESFDFIKNKVVLITGAGGSIGSEICRQLIEFKPKHLVMVDHSEYNLYKISWEMENDLNFKDFTPVLASVSDAALMDSIFSQHRPALVFHAAAYKHVPLLENQEKQAVENNFFGTKRVAEISSLYGADKFILISTDKAVNPTNVMGATKRMAEIFCQHFNSLSKTQYITVRFGNVLGSAGSVIPLFKKQLRQGGPLTVTHPDITRFFMSIQEASQLVLQAGSMGTGGEIFVLDMGQPMKISKLAETLITLMGKKPYVDIDIVYTGLRPGEKLYEELFYESENHTSTKNKKIFLSQSSGSNVINFEENIRDLETIMKSGTAKDIREIITRIIR